MRQASFLLVDDDPCAVRLLGSIVTGLGDVRVATSGAQALELARQVPPDLLLLDAEMPGMDGLQVCKAMRADPVLTGVPVIFVTSRRDAALELAGFQLGAADFIAKPLDAALVLARVGAQLRFKRTADELRRVATNDPLTGALNRRRFNEVLGSEWRRARRGPHALALILAEIDHLQAFQEHHGDRAAESCVRAIALFLAAAARRPADVLARLDAAAFALLLPQTPRAGAAHMAHRLLDGVDSLAFPHRASPTACHVTVTLGIAVVDEASACWLAHPANARPAGDAPAAGSAADLFRAATNALKAAADAGRAQARVLDVASFACPGAAQEIAPPRRRHERRRAV